MSPFPHVRIRTAVTLYFMYNIIYHALPKIYLVSEQLRVSLISITVAVLLLCRCAVGLSHQLGDWRQQWREIQKDDTDRQMDKHAHTRALGHTDRHRHTPRERQRERESHQSRAQTKNDTSYILKHRRVSQGLRGHEATSSSAGTAVHLTSAYLRYLWHCCDLFSRVVLSQTALLHFSRSFLLRPTIQNKMNYFALNLIPRAQPPFIPFLLLSIPCPNSIYPPSRRSGDLVYSMCFVLCSAIWQFLFCVSSS